MSQMPTFRPSAQRISRESYLYEAAFLAAKRGTCSRRQVGALAVLSGRIIASGYNGAPAGVDHCVHDHLKENDPKNGTYEGCQVAVHAEANLIAFSARKGIALEGLDLYCTDMPCLKCAQLIINADFNSVSYYRDYRITDGLELLHKSGIKTVDLGKQSWLLNEERK
jgi:dCMP deaminase